MRVTPERFEQLAFEEAEAVLAKLPPDLRAEAETVILQVEDEADPTLGGERRMLLDKDWGWWAGRILADLARPHPDIRECVRRIDIMRLGHAMIRPAPGFLFSEERRRWLAPRNGVFFANSDLSGLSLFEEAQYRGVDAADRALRMLSR